MMYNFIKFFCAVILSVTMASCKSPVLQTDWPPICPDIVYKEDWDARIPEAVDYALVPVKYVVVHHTVTPECTTNESCAGILQSIQNFHIDEMEFHDIGYNFLIGGDGKVYEGAGWHKVGAHTRGYNSRSIGIAFIGDFSNKKPHVRQLQAARDLLNCAVELGELDVNYKLFGARQVSPTLSPGTQLYNEIQKWKHFSKAP